MFCATFIFQTRSSVPPIGTLGIFLPLLGYYAAHHQRFFDGSHRLFPHRYPQPKRTGGAEPGPHLCGPVRLLLFHDGGRAVGIL